MEINIALVTYEAELLTESGTVYDLTPALISLQWDEEINGLSTKANLTVANMAIGGTWLMGIAKVGCFISVYSNWGAGRQKVFEGQIWEWGYSSTLQKEISLTAYDPAKYLLQSYDYFYFSAGLDTAAILSTICGEWGVPLNNAWKTMTHEKKVFSNDTIADMILTLLEEVSEHTGEKYVCHWKDGSLTIEERGTNSDVFTFDNSCTIGTDNKITINDLVTKVKILGTADDDGRSAVEAEVDGDQTYGVMQRILTRDSDKTLEAAIGEAETYIAERNQPDEQVSITVPDLPFLRKGDKVTVCAGNLIDDFYTTGVTHSATNKQMVLTLVRAK